MDDRRDSAEWSVKHWAGTVGQLVEAARLSAERVAALVPYPADYDPDEKPFDEGKYSQWHAAQAARELSIVIEENEGFTGRPRDLNDLAAISEKTVRQVESIAITVGQGSYQAPSVTLRCGKGLLNGLSVKIEGFDRTWTAGLKHELMRVLNPSRPIHAPLLGDKSNAMMAAGILFWAVVIGLDQLFLALGAGTQTSRIVFALLGAGLVTGVMILLGVASAQFELLMPGEKPRYHRWRGRVLGVAGAVFVGLSVSAIWALIGGS
jgi:hypothetical protein